MALSPPSSVTAAHWRHLERVRAAMATRIEAMWRATGFEAAPITETVQMVLAGQKAIVATTDADLAAMGNLTTGTNGRPAGLQADRLIGRHARNGVFLEDVYARPVTVARKSGFDRGLQHLRSAIYMDAQLAQRRAANAIVESDTRIVGWRRQVNPGAGKVCGLCVAASTRRYSVQALLPLHPMCRCSVYPIYDTDPIRSANYIDRERLNEVYARTNGSTDRSALGAIRFTADDLPPGIDSEAIAKLGPRVAWHSEYGPYLTGARHDSSFAVSP